MKSTATPNRYPASVIGHVRVSTDEQSLGPEAQAAALKPWLRLPAASPGHRPRRERGPREIGCLDLSAGCVPLPWGLDHVDPPVPHLARRNAGGSAVARVGLPLTDSVKRAMVSQTKEDSGVPSRGG